MNAAEIIRNAIPNASDLLVEIILWERTPFPVGAVTAKTLYKTEAGDSRRSSDSCCHRIYGLFKPSRRNSRTPGSYQGPGQRSSRAPQSFGTRNRRLQGRDGVNTPSRQGHASEQQCRIAAA